MEAIEALYQTNYNEAKDYFINMLNYNISSFIIILYGFLICNLLFKPSKNHIKIKINGNINAFNFGIFTIGLFFLFSSTNVSFFKDFLVNFKNYKIDKTLSAEMLQKANSYKFNYNLKTNKNIDIIVVIGESLTKHNMSLYGYEKNTTPNMDKSDLIKFNDVISPHSHTEQSLSQVLTLADISKGRYFSEFDSYSIIRMLKEAGYHTAWLSNQNEHGVWENKVASIGKQANKYLFLKSNYKFVNKTFDHELLPHISSVFNNNNKNNAIFVHLYANHGSYGDRYPSDFPMVEEWDSGKLGVTDHTRSVIRKYDTSVKYVDMIIDKIFKIADNREKPTIVIFVPDHGENTFDRTAHGSDNHNYVHVEIPFIFYANEKYKQIYYNKIREIKNNINKPYSSVDLPYSIMDILGVSGIPKIKEKSIFSKYLNIVERTTLSGRVNYDKKDRGVGAKGRAIYNLKQISERMGKKYANKVLPHRMNTIMPTKMARDVFSGVEIDVVYDSEKDMFDLYHPPLKSNNFSLEEYLTYIPNNLRLWLDWKNATPDNIKPAIKKLNKLNLKNRVIIETSEKFNGVDLISQSGYEQSYYLPTSEIEKCSNNDNKDCKILSHRIIDNIENNHFNAISFDVGDWNFYQKYLKDYIYNNNLNVHLWDSVTEISSKNFRNTMIYKYIVDDNVKTLLLQYKTGYKK